MSPRAKSRFTVLVVDDDPSVLATYGRLLNRSGYRAVTANDPRDVLRDEKLSNGGADLIILDYKMPGIDGLTLLAALRRRRCRARCILISAFLNEDVRNQARNLGVDRVLDKPIDIGALRRTIDELLPLDLGRSVGAVG